MTKGLSIIVAILAIAAGADAKKAETCEEQTKCNKCLKDDGCAWWVGTGAQEGEQKCVTASKCLPYVLEAELNDGQCYAGSTFPRVERACRRMKKGKPPLKCKTYNGEGNCYDCLTNGCDWEVKKQKCVKKSDEPSDGRKLLSFVDGGSANCYFYGIEYSDIQKCKAANGDCAACTTTALTPGWADNDDPYALPRYCGYIPETGKCVPKLGLPDGGRETCGNEEEDCDKEWPALQGKEVFAVESYLKSLGYNVALCPEVYLVEPRETVVPLPNPLDPPYYPELPDEEIVNDDPVKPDDPLEYPILPEEPVPLPNPLEPILPEEPEIVNDDPVKPDDQYDLPNDLVRATEKPMPDIVEVPDDYSGRRDLESVSGECYADEPVQCDRVRLFYEYKPKPKGGIAKPEYEPIVVRNIPQVG